MGHREPRVISPATNILFNWVKIRIPLSYFIADVIGSVA
jgi:hypothetical protein